MPCIHCIDNHETLSQTNSKQRDQIIKQNCRVESRLQYIRGQIESECEKRVQELANVITTLEATVKYYKGKSASLNKDVEELKVEKDNLENANSTLNGQVTELEKKLAIEKGVNYSLSEQINKLQSALGKKEKTTQFLKNADSTLNGQVTELEKNLATEQAKNSALSKEINSFKLSLGEGQERKHTGKTENSTTNCRIDELKKALVREQEKSSELEDVISHLQWKVSSLQQSLDSRDRPTEEELFSACKDMKRQKSQSELRVNELHSQIQTAEEEVKAKNSELKAKDVKIQELQEQITILQRAFGAKNQETQEQEHKHKPLVNDTRNGDGHRHEGKKMRRKHRHDKEGSSRSSIWSQNQGRKRT